MTAGFFLLAILFDFAFLIWKFNWMLEYAFFIAISGVVVLTVAFLYFAIGRIIDSIVGLFLSAADRRSITRGLGPPSPPSNQFSEGEKQLVEEMIQGERRRVCPRCGTGEFRVRPVSHDGVSLTRIWARCSDCRIVDEWEVPPY